MTVNERVISALGGIAETSPDIYEGDALEYIVFSYAESPRSIGEGTPTDIVCLLVVDYCAPKGMDTLLKRDQIAAALVSVGFTWPEIINASDRRGQRYIFECEGLKSG